MELSKAFKEAEEGRPVQVGDGVVYVRPADDAYYSRLDELETEYRKENGLEPFSRLSTAAQIRIGNRARMGTRVVTWEGFTVDGKKFPSHTKKGELIEENFAALLGIAPIEEAVSKAMQRLEAEQAEELGIARGN